MIKFYDIDENYVNWLQSIDTQVPNIAYRKNNKFLCGAVIEIDETKFYAPVSSNTKIFRTSLPIYDESTTPRTILSTIRFCFMIPAFDEVLTVKDFDVISKTDPTYANLIEKEWEYCRKHENTIIEKAQQVYSIGCNPNHVFNYTCCKFDVLKSRYQEYKPDKNNI